MEIAGMKVVDAVKKVKIVITNNDVKKGDNKNPSSCAAAQACLRQLKCTRAMVHIGRTYLQMGNKWIRFQTPEALRSEIIAFDRGGSFAAGEYELQAIRPSHRENGKHRSGSEKGRRNKIAKTKRAKPHQVTGIRHHGANR